MSLRTSTHRRRSGQLGDESLAVDLLDLCRLDLLHLYLLDSVG